MQTATAYEKFNNESFFDNDVIFSVLGKILQCRNNETSGHAQRTAEYAHILIKEMLLHRKFKKELIENDYPSIIKAMPLHDIGKVGIRDDILLKPGALTDEEYAEIKNHITFGMEIINSIKDKNVMSETAFKNCQNVIQYHHERWDGKGYLHGLKKENIPLAARIAAVVDVYDAVINPRCYKESFSHKKAIEIIKQGSGTHFDPEMVNCFIKVEKSIEKVYKR